MSDATPCPSFCEKCTQEILTDEIIIDPENNKHYHPDCARQVMADELKQCKYCMIGNCNMCQNMGDFSKCKCCVQFRWELVNKATKTIAQFNPKTFSELRRLIQS